MSVRRLGATTILPLTCTRSGSCCHGKDIRITPWELALLAQARGQDAILFRDAATADGGTRLRCDGPAGWRGLPACALYDPARGCTVHAARPLACRLYPLGRELAGGRERFFHEGRRLPCLDGCPEVAGLPQLDVRDYLEQQGVAPYAAVRDDYLEVAQDLAEGAFVLVFDSGLDRAGGADWRAGWRRNAAGGAMAWIAALGPAWHDRVVAPALAEPLGAGRRWCAAHRELLRAAAQAAFAGLRQPAALAAASATMLGGALLLIHAVGGDTAEIGRRWLARAGLRS